MEQATVFLRDTIDSVWQLTVKAWSVPPDIWLPVTLTTLLAFSVLRIFLEFLPSTFRGDSGLTQVRIKINALPEDDIVYLAPASMDKLFGTGHRPEALRIKSQRRKAYVHLAKRKNTTLESDMIEMNLRMFRRLFPEIEVPEEEEKKLVEQQLDIREHASSGWVGYWLTPNERARFQNRFAVYLGVGLVVLQLGLELGLRS